MNKKTISQDSYTDGVETEKIHALRPNLTEIVAMIDKLPDSFVDAYISLENDTPLYIDEERPGVFEYYSELLRLHCKHMNVSLSMFLREALIEKIEKLNTEENKYWMELPKRQVVIIYKSLKDFLESKDLESSEYCGHPSIFSGDSEENFDNTRKFCEKFQIGFSAFLNRAESDFEMGFDCECQIYEKLVGGIK